MPDSHLLTLHILQVGPSASSRAIPFNHADILDEEELEEAGAAAIGHSPRSGLHSGKVSPTRGGSETGAGSNDPEKATAAAAAAVVTSAAAGGFFGSPSPRIIRGGSGSGPGAATAIGSGTASAAGNSPTKNSPRGSSSTPSGAAAPGGGGSALPSKSPGGVNAPSGAPTEFFMPGGAGATSFTTYTRIAGR